MQSIPRIAVACLLSGSFATPALAAQHREASPPGAEAVWLRTKYVSETLDQLSANATLSMRQPPRHRSDPYPSMQRGYDCP